MTKPVLNQCRSCAIARKHGQHYCGVFDKNCLDCCARLVASARPCCQQQEKMLQSISNHPDGHGRETVLARLKQLDGARSD